MCVFVSTNKPVSADAIVHTLESRSWCLIVLLPNSPTPAPPLQLALEMKDEAIEALRGYEARCR